MYEVSHAVIVSVRNCPYGHNSQMTAIPIFHCRYKANSLCRHMLHNSYWNITAFVFVDLMVSLCLQFYQRVQNRGGNLQLITILRTTIWWFFFQKLFYLFFSLMSYMWFLHWKIIKIKTKVLYTPTQFELIGRNTTQLGLFIVVWKNALEHTGKPNGKMRQLASMFILRICKLSKQ